VCNRQVECDQLGFLKRRLRQLVQRKIDRAHAVPVAREPGLGRRQPEWLMAQLISEIRRMFTGTRVSTTLKECAAQ